MVLGVWWVVPVVIKGFFYNGFDEFQGPIWSTTSKIRDLGRYWGYKLNSKNSLIEANRDLARLNASHALVHMENEALKEEVGNLERLLDLPKLPEYEYILARVMRRDLATWSHQLVIQKGSRDGLKVGAAVIYANGIVGKIKKVKERSSVVELISSPTFRVAARFLGDVRPITYQGVSNGAFMNPVGRAFNIPMDIKIRKDEGKKLVSSKLGGVFPDGLTIGYLTGLSARADGLFQQGMVRLSEDLHNVQEVAVLVPLNDREGGG